MLFARAISKGYRRYCPDLTGGVLAYDPDELDQVVDVTPAAAVESATPMPERNGHTELTNGKAEDAQPAAEEVISEQEARIVLELIRIHNRDLEKFLKYFNIPRVEALPRREYDRACQLLQAPKSVVRKDQPVREGVPA
jgi:hypothetical protein